MADPNLQIPPAPALQALGIAAEALGARLPPLTVSAQRVAETVSPGAHGRRRVGLGESFWQFRPYQIGDTIDRIDWRQSAKGDRLYIRETEWAAAQTVFLWRDPGAGMDYSSRRALPTKRSRADLLLLALASLLARGGERIAVLGGGGAPRPPPPDPRKAGPGGGASTGRAALNAVRAGLAAARPLDAAGGAAPRHATLILFGDFLDPIDDIARSLDRVAAAGAGGQIVQILDPAELALPFGGRVRFREMTAGAAAGAEAGAEGAGDVLAPRVESLRPGYLDALQRQIAGVSALAAARGWGRLLHATDAPPDEPLKTLYARLSAQAAGAAP